MKNAAFGILLAGMIFMAGCKAFEPAMKTPLPLTIPENFSITAEEKVISKNRILPFGNNELDTLIQNATENNFDIKIIKTKIAQAKAKVEKENASFWPNLGFSFGGQKKRVQTRTGMSNDSTHADSHSWDSSLTGSYTADIWGEAKASKQASILSMYALEQDLKRSILELITDISETWVDIIATRQKKTILKKQIEINTTLLKLQTLRFINGKANALDVSQQQETLAESSSQLPLLEKQEQIFLNNLAFLSGKASMDNDIKVGTSTLPQTVSLPDTGVPSDLIENRHDIQAARLRLFSSQWEVTAAKADLLPSFSLTAQALFSNGELDLMFHNWIASLAASIAGPIFDGGFRRAEVKRAKAAAEEQLNIYAKTVASAIFEVEDSLVSIQKQGEYIKLLEEELELTRLTLKDASIQYKNGQSSYLSYLIAWTNIERLERQLVGEQATICKEHIKLNKILGVRSVQ
jgi:outer membrane protein, multidrug efflux system